MTSLLFLCSDCGDAFSRFADTACDKHSVCPSVSAREITPRMMIKSLFFSVFENVVEIASETSHRLRIQAKGNVKSVSQSVPVGYLKMPDCFI